MLELCLLGCGGMMPLPYRKLTSLMARYNGNSILIDCGEGTQVGIKEKGWSFKPIEVICFTHYHADHISGLPGLLLTLGNAQRTEPLLMVGPRGLERVVNSLRVIAPDLPFPIVFHELKEKEEVIEAAGCRITAFRVNHNVTCYGYTIEIDRAGKFDINKAICEGMYGEPEKKAKAIEYKHMTFYEAAEMAKKADVKKMWLTHYSPSLVRPEVYLEEVRKIFARTSAGKDGKSTTLLFEEE